MVACNESLKKAVEEGRFRSDLYYRLATYPVLIPSLKERREDINLNRTGFVGDFLFKLGHLT